MKALATAKRMKKGSPMESMERPRSANSCLRSTYQAPTLATRAAPAVQLAKNTCRMRGMKEGVKTTSQKSVITARTGSGVSCSS
jgi:hypothetical protein